jgi:hypothetical protein
MPIQARLPSLRVLSSLAMSFLLAVSAVALLVVGSPVSGADDFLSSLSVVGGLADTSDLQPLMQMEAAGVSVSPTKSRATVGKQVRQSVPDRNRSTSYRTDELFRNSKVAVPLLVSDLESHRVVVDIQPMSGRSVGARPSAAWTRPLVITAASAASGESTHRATTSWTAYGRH